MDPESTLQATVTLRRALLRAYDPSLAEILRRPPDRVGITDALYEFERLVEKLYALGLITSDAPPEEQ